MMPPALPTTPRSSGRRHGTASTSGAVIDESAPTAKSTTAEGDESVTAVKHMSNDVAAEHNTSNLLGRPERMQSIGPNRHPAMPPSVTAIARPFAMAGGML